MEMEKELFIKHALFKHFGFPWEKLEFIDIWENPNKPELVCLISETPEFFKFSYMKVSGGNKEKLNYTIKFITLSKTNQEWDMNEEKHDISFNDEEVKDDLV